MDKCPTPETDAQTGRSHLPFKKVTSHKILGVIFDDRMCFQQHITKTLERAKTRMGKLARLQVGLRDGGSQNDCELPCYKSLTLRPGFGGIRSIRATAIPYRRCGD